MKKTAYISFVIAGAMLSGACDDHELPSGATLTMPVTSLVMEVSGESYTAVPSLDEDSHFTDILKLPVKIPSQEATVLAISLQPGYTTDLRAGDKVTFTDGKYVLQVSKNGLSEAYTVDMLFNPPPVVYAVKTSDKDEIGNGYFFNAATQDFLASRNYDNIYEGELNLTGSNWDNVGIVSADLTTIYNLAAGPWPATSHYVWTAETKAAKGDGYFPCDGPWNDWREINGNADIVSPGVWRVIFDSSSLEVDMTMTQWAINGSGVDRKTPMAYNPSTETWSLTASLKPGKIVFETTPVVFGDPVFRLGTKENILGQLAPDGDAIEISQAGTRTITLTLSNPPYYTYTIE